MRRVSIIGFGKIGQALAAQILRRGIDVTAVDTDPTLPLLFSQSHFHTGEPGVEEVLLQAYASRKLQVSGDFNEVEGCDAIIIAIPLLVGSDNKPATQVFSDCLRKLAPHCHNRLPVIIETSVPIGFCRNTALYELETAQKKHGVDFLLAHSPERIKSGTMLHQLSQIPKVIGGIDEEAGLAAAAVYAQFIEPGLLHRVKNTEAAEMVKMAGMIYRDVNIALSNQLAQLANALQIDMAGLIPLVNTDKEANLLQPGIGVGGHCTPVYPWFLVDNFERAGLDFTLARQSRMINDGMAAYAVSLAGATRNKKALILGLAFRPNVKEDAMSTTYLLNRELKKQGFEVFVHDTEFSDAEITACDLTPVTDLYHTDASVVFLVTMHHQYRDLDFMRLAQSGVEVVVDGRNSLDAGKIKEAGLRYAGIGKSV